MSRPIASTLVARSRPVHASSCILSLRDREIDLRASTASIGSFIFHLEVRARTFSACIKVPSVRASPANISQKIPCHHQSRLHYIFNL